MSLWKFMKNMCGYVVGRYWNKEPFDTRHRKRKSLAWPMRFNRLSFGAAATSCFASSTYSKSSSRSLCQCQTSFFVGRYWLQPTTLSCFILFHLCFNPFKSAACSSTLALSTTFASSSSGQSKRHPFDIMYQPTHALLC